MRIAICDDEEQYRAQLRALIGKIGGDLDAEIESFYDGNDLLSGFDRDPYDIVFLDIEMPEMDGITLAKNLRKKSEDVLIVFLTGHVEYAIEGYEVNALRYLTKPVQVDKLKEVLNFVNTRNASQRQLIVKEEGDELVINLADIIYFEAQNQNVKIFTVKGDHTVRYNIGDFEEQLKEDGFFRTHRGYLVSLARVKKLVKCDVILDSGSGDVAVPVSRSNTKPLKEALYSYVEGQAF